ncbi:HAMP domain-containing sensor histidine kinase [Amycolatopsis rhabdoformis]|uniref:histidine kinase n=1 Tax=Amycolatopsis rhabdoformis TaxID=1448059 RepID=A0ABZ1I257_9PSEU|nr:HAMP domain-containing sensor histidine kinase [Amycolatopsis rhabdoformis]WSE27653.1 HAMP domain-containing sensor histidine kinase [Amycolatopsis rhabdoformis]
MRLRAVIGVRVRTTAVAVVVLALAIAVACVVVVVLLEESLDRSVTESARSAGRQVAIQLVREGARDLSASDVASTGDTEAVTQVLDKNNVPIAGDPAITGHPPLTANRPAPGRETVETLPLGLNGDGADYRVVSQGVSGPGGPFIVISARSLEPVTEASTRLTLLLALISLPLLAIAGFAVYRSVGAALRPVERMRRTVAEVSTRDLTTRVPLPPGRDEVHRLAVTLNEMLTRLHSAQAAQRRFVADASHELRSPLSTISTALDVSGRHPETTGELVPVITRETARLRELVDDLLMLARTDDTTDQPASTEVDLDDIVRAEGRRISAEGPLRIEVRAGPAKVRGSEAQLRRAVRNLVDNARGHARERVRVASWVHDATAVVEVSDDGPGVAPEDRERVFERFVRLDASRQRGHGGTGLGLPIVAGIVARHGGRASYADVTDPSYPGAHFRIELPCFEED